MSEQADRAAGEAPSQTVGEPALQAAGEAPSQDSSRDGRAPQAARRWWRFPLVGGAILLAAALALVVANFLGSYRAGQAAQDALAQLDLAIEERVLDSSEADGAASAVWQLDREMPTVSVDGRDYLGIISIPSLNRELPVLASWDSSALDSSACRYSGSYYTDDLVIGGYNYASHFGPLLNVEIGAEVILTNADGRRIRYIVSNRETLRATSIDEMVENNQNSESTSDWDLTLFTCDLDGTTRCAVRCIRQ